MERRKRVRLSKLQHNLGLSPDAPADGRRSSNMMSGTERSNATHQDTGELSLLRGSGACSGSGVLPRWPWRQRVSMAAGLLIAGLLALTQAWCVNSIHENLLWFSQLTVGVMILCSALMRMNHAHRRQALAHSNSLWYELTYHNMVQIKTHPSAHSSSLSGHNIYIRPLL